MTFLVPGPGEGDMQVPIHSEPTHVFMVSKAETYKLISLLDQNINLTKMAHYFEVKT